ncbi:putative manganese resistance protein [Clavispora lusitaniae]|uniref:Manganese resistance protein n=1 Tax=Clavispora lusitaniae TaxID=36911 RepID=A0ACD0WFE4_CLALS|nr:putative manganese resistance protein [Clavispora lusitaniae]QFZ31921.1 putative manganese resistance protein [Clavispora lusitaniae]QFZ37590.1 putative manganese resistance protein [Clavispora lusitaniae]QFZ43274.1 putative manganese resistance protein [Clavispora lusitaniae]QFZ48950.1 putative manganese resistance protein [Clavispora lusitaniae]
MPKNRSSKNRRRNRKSTKAAREGRLQHDSESDAYEEDYLAASSRQPQRGSFVDHRGENLANFGSSASRHRFRSEAAQSRSKGSNTPLTNRNLQTWLEQSQPQAQTSQFGAVALDMDQYAKEQQNNRKSYHDHDDGDNYSTYSHRSGQSLEFGESNPSSEHSSDSTSLDDVCFPDYYEGLLDADNGETSHKWPDLSVLEEYIQEELEELHEAQQEREESPEVNFHYPVARRVSAAVGDLKDVSPTNESVPLLGSVQVNETHSLQSGSSSLRVRPKPIQPWEKNREHYSPILNNSQNRASDTTFRFTYFREDLEGTIHSPTLSGLVSRDKENVSKTEANLSESLHQLFSPSYYSKETSSTHEPSPGVEHAKLAETLPVPQTNLSTNNASAASASASTNTTGNASTGAAAGIRSANQRFSSPLPGSTANGASPATHHHSHPTYPFWLDIENPSEEEMKVISKTFGLHPLTTEDIFLGETREKVELFRQYYFICFTSFDIVYERRKQRAKENEKKHIKLQEYSWPEETSNNKGFFKRISKMLFSRRGSTYSSSKRSVTSSSITIHKNVRSGELCPLNMYMIIFKHGVLTFHFSPTPHPINVRRRARMLKDHLTVSTDWICYALIDDITDSFAPMIDSIESEVYLIEDEIMRMHSGDSEDSDEESDNEMSSSLPPTNQGYQRSIGTDVFYRRERSKSTVEAVTPNSFRSRYNKEPRGEFMSVNSRSSARTSLSSTSTSTSSKIVAWKRKGDMLRRIGECRKRVMSVMRLLGTKADVIRGFSKRFNETESLASLNDTHVNNTRLASRQEIVMYLGDIQDHVVTMVQSLNHYEKLLARSHSNYLAQLNIDMTKVNNDTNDVLGKITILGTIVLPINVVTGLWGMNCIVPGQDHEGLVWFWGIVIGITSFSVISYFYAKKVTGL